MLRRLGIAFCVLGFIAVCVAALVSPTEDRYFAGLAGIQDRLSAEAVQVVEASGVGSDNTFVTVRGRVVNVDLPEFAPPGFKKSELRKQLKEIDGVRAVTMTGDSQVLVEETEAPEPEPTATPEPEPTAVPEPTAMPAPTPTPAPSLPEIVSAFEIAAIDFEPGTAVLTNDDEGLLNVIADQLQGLSGGPIEVQAHTNNVGDPDVNLLLSQDRAAAVVDYLIDQGVDAALLTSQGYGASLPIADNATEQGRADNERVAFVVEGN